METDGAAELFSRLAVNLHEAAMAGAEETAETLMAFAVQAVGCSHAGLALGAGGRLEIAAVSDPWVEKIYRFQFETGEGPLVTAYLYDAVVRVRDARSDPRWPAWSARVTACDVHGVLQIPLRASHQTIGVLGLYTTAPGGFSAEDEAVAEILAQHAAVAVSTVERSENLTAAVDARKLVGQAMGILMERYAIDDDRAFAVLRRYSQDTNTKLRDVAQLLIDTRKLPLVAHDSQPSPLGQTEARQEERR